MSTRDFLLYVAVPLAVVAATLRPLWLRASGDGLASAAGDISATVESNSDDLAAMPATLIDAQSMVAARARALGSQRAAGTAGIAATTRLQDHLQQALADAHCTDSLCRLTLDDLSGPQVLDDLDLRLLDGSRTTCRKTSAGRCELFGELAAQEV